MSSRGGGRGLHATLAPPGAAPLVHVQLAPPAALPRSTHAMVAEHIEGSMVGVMQDLRVTTVDRNAELAEAYGLVRERVAACSEALRREAAARDVQYEALQRALAAAFEAADRELHEAVGATFSLAAAAVPPLHAQLDEAAVTETQAYAVEVPATNERMCGAHIREMEGHREALLLDDTTIRAREARLVARLETHEAGYGVRCKVEAEDRERQVAAFSAQFKASVSEALP